MKSLFVTFAALAGITTAHAAETWICSVIDAGKPQVIKLNVENGAVSLSSWGTRIIQKYQVVPSPDPKLRLIEDTKDSLIAIDKPAHVHESGQRSDLSVVVYALNKTTGELSRTMVSTATAASEMRGNCTQ